MKIFLLSIFAVCVVATYASAQQTGFGYGVKAGVNISKYTGGDADFKAGFTGGIFADYRFCDRFALSADVLYARQGAKGDEGKLRTDNLNIPVLANFYIVKGLAVKAGVQPGFLLSAKSKEDGVTTDVKDAFKKFDLSIPVGLSYDFRFGLILDARYNIGVSNISKVDGTTARNSVIAVTAGWRF